VFVTQNAASGKSEVHFWNTRTDEAMVFAELAGSVASLAFNPEGDLLAISNQEGEISLWNGATGKELVQLHTRKAASNIQFSPDGLLLVSVGSGGDVRLWGMPA